MTKAQVRARTKKVTRRMKWLDLKMGDWLCGVEKGQGLKPGEKIVRICVIRVLTVRRERLNVLLDPSRFDYARREMILEGFPGMAPDQFVQMYCKANGCKPSDEITRIQFRYPTQEEWCDSVDEGKI